MSAGLPPEGETVLAFSPTDGVGLAKRESGFGRVEWLWVHKLINGIPVVKDVTHYVRITMPAAGK